MRTSSAASGWRRSTARYRENLSPATGEPFCEVADSAPADVELALDAAHAAKDDVGRGARRPSAPRCSNAIADAIEENLEMLAVAESWENGKPVRETLAADIPLAVDHFRYFAGAVRAEEGSDLGDRRADLRLPLPRAARRRRADHPVQLPAADGGVEDRPGARRAATARSIKPASPTPWSILKLCRGDRATSSRRA